MSEFFVRGFAEGCGARAADGWRLRTGRSRTPVVHAGGDAGDSQSLRNEALEELGAQIILAILSFISAAGARADPQAGRLHKFMAWERAILTDSGGYQVFSLSDCAKSPMKACVSLASWTVEHLLTPEKAAEIQLALGRISRWCWTSALRRRRCATLRKPQ
jgi:queuine tRNA-ribosyltransferase